MPSFAPNDAHQCSVFHPFPCGFPNKNTCFFKIYPQTTHLFFVICHLFTNNKKRKQKTNKKSKQKNKQKNIPSFAPNDTRNDTLNNNHPKQNKKKKRRAHHCSFFHPVPCGIPDKNTCFFKRHPQTTHFWFVSSHLFTNKKNSNKTKNKKQTYRHSRRAVFLKKHTFFQNTPTNNRPCFRPLF